MLPPTSRDVALTALTLSGILCLRNAFFSSTSSAQRQTLTQAAADLVDRTLPYPALKEKLIAEKPHDQVAFLVNHREFVAAVPPAFWHPAKCTPSDLPPAHYSGIKALERALRLDHSTQDKTWALLEAWLSDVWSAYPDLHREALGWKNAE